MNSYQVQIDEAKRLVASAQATLDAAVAKLNHLVANAVGDGPDVSEWQGNVDWAKIKTAGAGFAFVRSSDGDRVDTAYNALRVSALRVAGLVFGPYHFARVAADTNNQRDGRTEAAMAYFYAARHGWGRPGDLPLTYDFEGGSLLNQPAAKCGAHLMQFVRAYRGLTGHLPIVYTNPGTMSLVVPTLASSDQTLLRTCPLWVAHWGVAQPSIPAPWTAWSFWQYTDAGILDGVTGGVDMNRFIGSKDDLKALAIV